MNYRENDEELKYYGSDLNKWIAKECSREMTAINIDLIMWKRSKRMLKIIESKHFNENVPRTQREILNMVALIIKPAIDLLCNFNSFGVYIVTGDPPNFARGVEIEDLHKRVTYILNADSFKRWIEFEYDLQDSDLKPEDDFFNGEILVPMRR